MLHVTWCEGSEPSVLFEVSDLLAATCLGCEICNLFVGMYLRMWLPDLFGGSVWCCEMSGVFTAQWSRVWSLWPVWGCSSRTWLLSSVCFQHAPGNVWPLTFGGFTSQNMSSVTYWGVHVPGCQISQVWGEYFQAYEISDLFADIYVSMPIYLYLYIHLCLYVLIWSEGVYAQAV